ncbi:MAG: DNA-processing protein DprA, partial [Clostridiales bacterium]|nr:DNA-processing protein DprA [Clostridiales bacterium]
MMFGIVGTRKASPRPLELTHKMAYLLSKAGLTIVSGMAAGIDSAAACGALDAGGKTVAVFGPGVDVCYPSSNRSLMEAIMKNGCVISENSPGTPALPWTFPQRNRIIAGMSVGVLVTAAPEKSGSVITATRAMEQGRDVFVTPGAPDAEEFKGSLALIKDGAEMVTDAEDILISYGLKPVSTDIGYEQAVRARRLQGSHLAPKIREKRGNMDNHVQTKRENSGKAQKKTDITEGMSEIRKRIVEAILEGVDQFDLIAQRTGIDAATLSVELTMLELDGKLNQKPGRHYELTP